jgi:hypothetical protein
VEVEDEVVEAAVVNEDEEDEIVEELGKDWRRGRWGGAGRGVRAACRLGAASSRSRGEVEHSDDDEEGRGGVDHGRHGISSGGPSLNVTRFLMIACFPSSGCPRFFISADPKDPGLTSLAAYQFSAQNDNLKKEQRAIDVSTRIQFRFEIA